MNQQKQQAESLRGLLVQARASESLARQQLLVLVGRPPQQDIAVESRSLPPLVALPAPGVPADLLERRPDIRAAWLRLQASDRLKAAAVADLFPRIRLTATLFYQEREVTRLFAESLWSLAASATQPVWDGGRRFAEIDRAEAAAEAHLFQYGQTVLVALQEVQDALVLDERVTIPEISGFPPPEISIEVPHENLRRYRITQCSTSSSRLTLVQSVHLLQDFTVAQQRTLSQEDRPSKSVPPPLSDVGNARMLGSANATMESASPES